MLSPPWTSIESTVEILAFGMNSGAAVIALLVISFVQVVIIGWLVTLRVMIVRESKRQCLFAPFYDGGEHNGQYIKLQSLTFNRKSTGLRYVKIYRWYGHPNASQNME